VRASLEPPVIPFHRVATYTLTVEAPAGLEVKLPALKEDIEGMTVRAEAPVSEDLKKGRRRIVQRYILDPVAIKTYLLPPAEVTWDADGKAEVPALALEVRDLTDAEKEAAENFVNLAGPGELPPARSARGWIWALGAALLAALLAAGWILRRRRNGEPAAPLPTPWEVAYQRLLELEARKLAESGRYEAYYVDLSAIIRYYIEDRFALRAPEQTTPEFLEASAQSGVLSEPQQESLSKFLRHCDRVKFALYRPSVEEMAQSFSVVRDFVRETVPAPAPSETAEVAA
jgi:hypothetical protein